MTCVWGGSDSRSLTGCQDGTSRDPTAKHGPTRIPAPEQTHAAYTDLTLHHIWSGTQLKFTLVCWETIKLWINCFRSDVVHYLHQNGLFSRHSCSYLCQTHQVPFVLARNSIYYYNLHHKSRFWRRFPGERLGPDWSFPSHDMQILLKGRKMFPSQLGETWPLKPVLSGETLFQEPYICAVRRPKQSSPFRAAAGFISDCKGPRRSHVDVPQARWARSWETDLWDFTHGFLKRVHLLFHTERNTALYKELNDRHYTDRYYIISILVCLNNV